jgi:hypothetical protein
MAKVITGVFPKKEAVKTEKADKPVPSYILHISLTFSDPLIWRRVQVPGSISLATFHHVIQLSMGWSDTHAHQFHVGKISYEPTLGSAAIGETKRYDERNFQLQDLEESMRFMFAYLYDAGDIWEHEIRLEEVVYPSEKLHNPVLLAGEQACPPETISDVHEYQALLTSLENPAVNGHQKLSELTGSSDFDPNFFDLEAARHRLQLLK